jgi:AcrR family transcriptional regulator
MDDGEVGEGGSARRLPASMEVAWGLRDRPAKGPKPGLSLDRIVSAGVRIAQADGLPAVSMSKVAAEVGVTAMALYRYVGNKNELLALMVDAGIGAPPVPRPGQGWRAGLTEWAQAQNAAYRRHPWALRIPISGLPSLPNEVTWLDYGLRCLGGAAIGEEDKLSAILLISNLVRVYSTMEQDLSALFAGVSGAEADQVMTGFAQTLGGLAGPERFPALSQALASGALDKADPVDKELTFGLDRVLDGIAALIARSQPE